MRVYVHVFPPIACTLCHGGYLFFQLCREDCMHYLSLYASPLSAPSPALCTRHVFRVTLDYLGLPSVLQGLCVLGGLVCRRHSRFPESEPAVCLGSC